LLEKGAAVVYGQEPQQTIRTWTESKELELAMPWKKGEGEQNQMRQPNESWIAHKEKEGSWN